MSLTLVYNELYGSLHVPLFLKPWMESFERPERVSLTMCKLRGYGLLEYLNVVSPHPASKEDILSVHSPYLYDLVRELSKFERGEVGSSSFTSKDTFRLACLAAGGAIEAVDLVLEGKCRSSLALVRPPGHHAGQSHASGLCFFNNAAVAVKSLQRRGVRKVLILDVDSHPGDGTAQIFYSDPSVLVLSFHEYDQEVAGAGWLDEKGYEKGEGYTINIPLPLGLRGKPYLWVFERVFHNVAEWFKPDFVVVSLGLDTHYDDPVGNLFLQALDHAEITGHILSIADEYCRGRVSFILEGGYSLLALPLSVAAVISRIVDSKIEYYDEIERGGSPPQHLKRLVASLLDRISSYTGP
ncbi:MAG: histone deacetylase [Candidatus Jordarchaeales archaeon]|nr:histone deacetylase [Candidatus Jordarchaeia archaeon]